MYTLKPPFKVDCFKCQEKKVTVKFLPPLQHFSNKNNWGYWTDKKENENNYVCDACLIDMYRNHKQIYLNSISNSKKRRTFRAYFGGKVSSPLTKTQQEHLEKSELHNILEKKGINLAEDGLDDYLENWRQIMLKLIKENSLWAKKVKELERTLTKKKKKKKALINRELITELLMFNLFLKCIR